MAQPDSAGLEAEIAAFVSAAAAAPLPVVQLTVERAGGVPVVRGRVLSHAQVRILRKIAASRDAELQLEVVGDPGARLEQGWLSIGSGVAELWRDPASVGQELARQTEYIPSDGPLRLLGRKGAFLLVQGADLSIGWVPFDQLSEADPDASRRQWDGRVRAEPERAVLPQGAELLEGLLQGARAQLGVPYRWGGTTARGYDCSGLVQRLISTHTGVLLPKHSGNQRRVGLRVPSAVAQPGDLLFASPRGQRVGHVMLVTAPGRVLHACRTEHKVIEESIADNVSRYMHRGCRRPVLLAAPSS